MVMMSKVLASLPSAFAAAFVLLCLTPAAQSSETPPFGFDAMEVVKTDWNVRGLLVTDLDLDGRADLALINNDKARIELYRQRDPDKPVADPKRLTFNRWEPVLEDTRFERIGLTTGVLMYDLAAGDLNHDGRPDLAYIDDTSHLVVHWQGDDLSFEQRQRIPVDNLAKELRTIQIRDLDGDTKQELILRTRRKILVYGLGENDRLENLSRTLVASDSLLDVILLDLNADKRLDFLYSVPAENHALRMRLQENAYRFGPERVLACDLPAVYPVLVAYSNATRLATIQQDSGIIEELHVGPPQSKTSGSLFASSVQAYPVPVSGKGANVQFIWADFDGDGRKDMAASDPDGAQFFVYLQDQDGNLTSPSTYPAFSGVTGLAASHVPGKGAVLFLASESEQALGMCRMGDKGRFGFPQLLTSEHTPLLLLAEAKGTITELTQIVKDGSKRYVTRNRVQSDGTMEELQSLLLEELRADPSAMKQLDLNQDGRMDLMLFVPYKPAMVLIQGEDGALSLLDAASNFGKGLFDKLEASAIRGRDLDGDGKEEILICREGYVRAIRLNANGAVDVVEQFNASEPSVDIAASLFLELNGTAPAELVLLDVKRSRAEILVADEAGLYHSSEQIDLPDLTAKRVDILDLDGDKSDDVFVFGDRSFTRFTLKPAETVVTREGTFETDLPTVIHRRLETGDLNGDGQTDLIAIDPGGSHYIELLSRDDSGTWASALHFQVFETDPHFRGRKGTDQEPKQVLARDVTGDGKDDLLLLIHDRILLYPQSP